jgi:hypothetical protein
MQLGNHCIGPITSSEDVRVEKSQSKILGRIGCHKKHQIWFSYATTTAKQVFPHDYS